MPAEGATSIDVGATLGDENAIGKVVGATEKAAEVERGVMRPDLDAEGASGFGLRRESVLVVERTGTVCPAG